MKKIIAIIFMVSTMDAMKNKGTQTFSPSVLAALEELHENHEELEPRLQKALIRRSMPDLFGVTQAECLLPQGLACCKDARLRTEYLSAIAITDSLAQKAVAVNWLAVMYREPASSALSRGVFANKYKTDGFTIEGIRVAQ